MVARKDMVGVKCGQLTVLEYAGSPKGIALWKCVCECGRECIVAGSLLRNGNRIRCGCKPSRYKHGHASTPQYIAWKGMIQRCTNPNHRGYKRYGGRGIQVCERWRTSYENFLADMGPRSDGKLTVERKDTNGNYEPGNCCWATYKEQARNTSRNHVIEVNGESKTVAEWAESSGIGYRTIMSRLQMGWTEHDAVTLPKKLKWSRHEKHAESYK